VKAASPLTLNPVVNGDSLPFVGPEPHSVAPLKAPVAPRRGELKKKIINVLTKSSEPWLPLLGEGRG